MIHREAILHTPLSQYAYAPNGKQLTIRLRAARSNLTSCTLLYGDRAQNSDPILFTETPMFLTASDELFDYFDITFSPEFIRVCYYFSLTASDETILYCSDLFITEPPPTRSEFYQYPYIRREEISDVPAWFKKARVYNIFPDSFANSKSNLNVCEKSVLIANGSISKSKLGGTVKGVTENLDYIKNLGFNCVYLNPIFTAGEYHKYDLIDYFHIDPCFGTDDDFAELVDTAHSMNMHVIIDGVFNHCGLHFFAFQDVISKGVDSEYASWFYDLEIPVIGTDGSQPPNYSCFAYEPKMPKLNTSNPATRDYFIEVCKYWIRNYKIDGWRLDVANEVDKEFWRAFRRAAKSENHECVLIAEIWESAESWLLGDMFDSTMNYDFRKHCREFFALGRIDAYTFSSRATQMLMRYPFGIVCGQLNLLDTHDVSRFLSLCGGDERRFKLATLLLMIFPGVPSVFYADELGAEGVTEPEYRQSMPWGNESNLLLFFKQANLLRENLDVTCGSYKVLQAEKGSMVYIVERKTDAKSVVLLLNAGISPEKLKNDNIPQYCPMLSHGYSSDTVSEYGYAVWVREKWQFNLI
ncbi:MAG: glycoside hydrolase family 13 protein [Christensenella sp.]